MFKFLAFITSKTDAFLLQLHALTPSKTIGVSDMYKTLTMPGEQGLPQDLKELLIEFLEKGGELVVVTGDAIPTAEKLFLNHLDYHGDTPLNLYIITEFGRQYWRYSIGANGSKLDTIYTGESIKVGVRIKMLERINRLIETVYGTTPVFSQEEWLKLASFEGAQVFIHDKIPALKEKAFVELRPSKVTIVFCEIEKINPEKTHLLQLIYTDPVLDKFSRENTLHKVEPDNAYTEFSKVTKEDGVKGFFSTETGKQLGLEKKAVLVTGDSKNDIALFRAFENENVFKGFVGPDSAYFEKVLNPQQHPRFVLFLGEHTQGTAKMYQALVKGH